MNLYLILIEAVFEGPGTDTKQQYLMEILLIIFGAFLLGYLFRFFLNSNMRQKMSALEDALDEAKAKGNSSSAAEQRNALEEKDEKIRALNRDLSNVQADLVKAQQSVKQNTFKSQIEPVKDSLVKIEGVGPKIAQMLSGGGLDTFKKLADSSPEAIKQVLLKAGPNYAVHDPSTWPEQARLCMQKDWEALKSLQAALKGGRKRR